MDRDTHFPCLWGQNPVFSALYPGDFPGEHVFWVTVSGCSPKTIKSRNMLRGRIIGNLCDFHWYRFVGNLPSGVAVVTLKVSPFRDAGRAGARLTTTLGVHASATSPTSPILTPQDRRHGRGTGGPWQAAYPSLTRAAGLPMPLTRYGEAYQLGVCDVRRSGRVDRMDDANHRRNSATSPTGPVALVDCLRRMGAITAGSDESIDGSLCRGYHPCAVAELSVGHCSRASPGYSTLVLEIAVLAIFSHVLESVHLPSYMLTLGGLMSP